LVPQESIEVEKVYFLVEKTASIIWVAKVDDIIHTFCC
jgi:hypothetical protein